MEPVPKGVYVCDGSPRPGDLGCVERMILACKTKKAGSLFKEMFCEINILGLDALKLYAQKGSDVAPHVL